MESEREHYRVMKTSKDIIMNTQGIVEVRTVSKVVVKWTWLWRWSFFSLLRLLIVKYRKIIEFRRKRIIHIV